MHAFKSITVLSKGQINSIGGTLTCSIDRLDELRWDDRSFKNLTVAVVDREQDELLSGLGLDGLLGFDAFKDSVVTFDFTREEIKFLPTAPWKDRTDCISMTLDGHKVLVEAEVGRLRGLFLVDTGAPYCALNDDMAKAAGLQEPQETRDSTGKIVKRTLLPSIRVGRVTCDEIVAKVRPNLLASKGEVGTLGCQFLYRLGGMTIDYKSKSLAFLHSTPARKVEDLKIAADAGAAWAQWTLYGLHRDGVVVKHDEALALRWLKNSAGAGNEDALMQLGALYFRGVEGVEKDYVSAFDCFSRAAKLGAPESFAWLGMLCRDGLGTKQDLQNAFECFDRGAKAGDIASQADLGTAYLNGMGVRQDSTSGIFWLKRAAIRQDERAQYRLGCCYLRGEHVERNVAEAIRWFRRSADQSYTASMYELGRACENGLTGEVDLLQAKAWYRRAAESGHQDAKKALIRLGSTEVPPK